MLFSRGGQEKHVIRHGGQEKGLLSFGSQEKIGYLVVEVRKNMLFSRGVQKKNLFSRGSQVWRNLLFSREGLQLYKNVYKFQLSF